MGDTIGARVRWAGLVLMGILLAPCVFAGAPITQGGFTAQGSVSFPSASGASGDLFALFANQSAGLKTLAITGLGVRVHLYEERYSRADAIPDTPVLLPVSPSNHAEWTTTHARVTLQEAGAGWLGVHARGGGAFTKLGGSPFDVATSLHEQIGDGQGVAEKDGGDPARPTFNATVMAAHLHVGAQHVRFEGAGLVKLMGPTVLLVGDENETSVKTGVFYDGDSKLGTLTLRWLSLEMEHALFEADGASFAVATGPLTTRASGSMGIEAAEGNLATSAQTFHASGGPIFLEGDLGATIEPYSLDGMPTMRVDVEGTLESTSLVGVAVAAPGAPGGWLPPLALGVALGAGGLVLAHVARRPRHWDPEDCLALAEQAADARQFDLALEWIRRARLTSPTSQRLLLKEAYLLSLRGAPHEALELLRKHPEHAQGPEGALVLARVLIASGERGRAGEVLADAMREEPILLVEIEGDATFAPLKDEEPLRHAMQHARAWLDRGE